MSILKRSATLFAIATLLGVGSAAAQGTGAFQWYVGGHGGIMSFRTPTEGREVFAVGGGELLVTAKRTGLLISVDQAFGSDETTQTFFQVRDSLGNVSNAGTVDWTFKGIRKYSAVLLAYPIRNRNVQPFVGVGGGIIHTTSNSAGPFADGSVESHLSSAGFGTAVVGLEFRLGPVGAFGAYQVTTKQGFKSISTVVSRNQTGKATATRDDFGEWTLGATHTLTGGIRFSLGSAKEAVKTGGY
jgi:hypothetical protein